MGKEMPGREGRRRRIETGAAAVEFALVVPLLVVLVLGIISYGVMLSFRQTLSQATTEGARAAAVTLIDAQKTDQGRAAVNDALASTGVSCTAGSLLRDGAPAGTCVVGAPVPCLTGAATSRCVTVTLAYEYDAHPLVPSFPGVGVVLPSTLTYSATARVS